MHINEQQDITKTCLLSGLQAQDFYIVLQPKICLKTDKPMGAEALLRWNHPLYKNMPVDQWIRIAQTNGLLPQLTSFVFREVLNALKMQADLKISFNVSPCCLTGDFCTSLLQELKKSAVDPTRLIIEITESTEILSMKTLATNVKQLREAGVKIALDDFGVGFSSMKYLVDIAADYVKIDREFVRKAPGNKTASIVFKTLIDVAQDLGIRVVVEGVETPDQLALTKEFGADYVQGFIFSRPLSVMHFMEFYAKSSFLSAA